MENLKGNILYGQSGGPTSVINSSFYGLIKEANNHKDKIEKIICMHYGIEGLLEGKYEEIDPSNYKHYEKLLNTSGAYFGSNRYKLKDFKEDDTDYKVILKFFKDHNIRYFFYNGGNDSMDTINKIDAYLKENNYECRSVGIPKTIDNDLIDTDFSFGFPSSAKFVINSIINVYNDDASYQIGRVNIIEVMGRNAGWLTASAALLKRHNVDVDLIYLPEFPFDLQEFLAKVNTIFKEKKRCLVVVSEGIRDRGGNLLAVNNDQRDKFNHHTLGGVAQFLTHAVERSLGLRVRPIELSLLQRANSFSPSKIDQDLAIKASEFIISNIVEKDINNKMLAIKYEGNDNYSFNFIDIAKAANEERKMGEEYLDPITHEIKEEYLDYVARLIKGKIDTFNEDGLIDYLVK